MADPTIDNTRAGYERAAEHEIAELYQAAKSRVRTLAVRYHPDLQPVGFGILRYVLDNSPVRAGDIVMSLGMDKGAVSRQVSALKDMGLIELEDDPDDRRAMLIVPTQKSLALRQTIRGETTSGYGLIFSDWSDDDVRDLALLMKRFNNSMH